MTFSFTDQWMLEDDDDVRITIHGSNVDFYAYKNWLVESIRERRETTQGWFGPVETWTRENPEAAPEVEVQDGGGNLLPLNPAIVNQVGYRSISHFYAGTNPSASMVSDITSMRVSYTRRGDRVERIVGSNWVTKAATVVVVVVVVVILILIFGVWWL